MSSPWDSDNDLESDYSSDSSFDDDEVNCRVKPHWPSFLSLFERRGIQLETVRHVKEYYNSRGLPANLPGCASTDDDALCPDYGLPDSLFRGTRLADGKKVVIKAVHLCSREYDVIRILSSPPLRNDPMNHTIPILDLIAATGDGLAFIVMEQWSSQLVLNDASCFVSFLSAIRQCIEHVAFLHKNHIVHLDISAHNILTDYNGHYAYIDYESSHRFIGTEQPVLYNYYRGTEVPPECEREGRCDPYKVDIWALGILIFRACKATGFAPLQMTQLVKLMLQEIPERRPSALSVLDSFINMFTPAFQKGGVEAL